MPLSEVSFNTLDDESVALLDMGRTCLNVNGMALEHTICKQEDKVEAVHVKA